MKEIKKIFGNWRLVLVLVGVASFFLFDPHSAVALSTKDFFRLNPKDYFQIASGPITFSKTKTRDGELFYLLINGKATCLKNLPLSPKEFRITFSIVAKHKITNNQQTLNSSYIININPFPKKKGQSFGLTKKIPLRFPKKSKPGDYLISGKPIKAEIKLPILGWRNVTNYLPKNLLRSKEFGIVKYVTK